jgi:zinc transporter, ZIP family
MLERWQEDVVDDLGQQRVALWSPRQTRHPPRSREPPRGVGLLMGTALAWGALSASSLVIGALLGLGRRWPDRQVGIVLAFGAGALISAVSFELVEEGTNVGGSGSVGLGLAVGAAAYFFADRAVERRNPGGGSALALGAFLDGIPEQAVLGISVAGGEGVSVGLIVAIFVSNLPEAIGSATEMRAGGIGAGRIRRLWVAVAIVCTLASAAGYAIADSTGGDLQAAIDGFAAGALLVMLTDSMIPDASGKAGRVAGLVTVLGFAVAAALSSLSA